MWPFTCKHCKQNKQKLDDFLSGKIKLATLHADETGVRMDFIGELLLPFVNALIVWFKSSKAPNYIAVRVQHKVTGEEYEVIVKPITNKTPAQLHLEEKARADSLADHIKRYQQATNVGVMVLGKMKSGNDVPVEHCAVTAKDIEQVTDAPAEPKANPILHSELHE